MAHNDESGPSDKPFWQLSKEMEVGNTQVCHDEPMEDAGNSTGTGEDAGYSTGVGGDTGYSTRDEHDTIASGAEDETTDGGGQTDGSQAKKRWRERRNNELGKTRQDFTEISSKGYPLAPREVVATFGNQIGCMVRETVKITTADLRKPEN